MPDWSTDSTLWSSGTPIASPTPGSDSVRAWRTEVPLVEYTITGIEPFGDETVVTCTVTGDFPGSPFAGLKFHFEEFDADQVKVLRIRT
ncbi:hypothetical protein ACIQCF_08145 [Streptomyces sp. NPDC088353]|uniref:hypothetical protein n=1 Tax=Streptomyces sp. NPDC088353 TaxID=3365855 RepID=UPI003830CFF5